MRECSEICNYYSFNCLARKYNSASATVKALIMPSKSLKPKSKFPTISSMPMKPNANPVNTDTINWNTAINCLFSCFTEI